MSKNPYEQFFAKAQEVKLGDEPKDKVRFSTKPKSKTATPAPQTTEQKMRTAMKTKRRPKSPPPWKAIGGLGISLALAIAYLAWPSTFEKILNKIEVRAIGGAEAAEKETGKKGGSEAAEKSQSGEVKGEKPSAAANGSEKGKGPEEKSNVSEEFSQFEKLKQRKDELDAREKELTELEEELQRQKVELDKRITQLEGMRGEIAKTLKDRVDVDQEKVAKLVDLYTNMKPKQAADVIGTINEELAVEVLSKMKKKSAAEIMNLLSPEKSRILSEKYTGYRRISSTESKGQ